MKKRFYIKNMVCDRCIKVLRNELSAAKITFSDIELGAVTLDLKNQNEKQVWENILDQNGFAILNNENLQLVEQVKLVMIKLLDNLPLQSEKKLSEILSDELHRDYSKISRIFSYNEKLTLEKYYIKLKIEKAKELIKDGELNFTEISQVLNYSNLTHLSNQFKNETGMSLTEFKLLDQNFRSPLDRII